jgi:hypothetical protein
MKYLLLSLLLLLAGISEGIDKKSPTGGTVKDKPGKIQVPSYIEVTQRPAVAPSTSFVELARVTLPEGTWDISASAQLLGDSSNVVCPCYFSISENTSVGYTSLIPYPKNGKNPIATTTYAYGSTNVVMPTIRWTVPSGQTKVIYFNESMASTNGSAYDTSYAYNNWAYLRANLVK